MSEMIRHTFQFVCPVCSGHAGLQARAGKRCAGFTLTDEVSKVSYCTREEYAGSLPLRDTVPAAYKHTITTPCDCGVDHMKQWQTQSPAVVSTVRVREFPLADEKTMAKVYAYLLALLPITNEHKQFYTGRSPIDMLVATELSYGRLPSCEDEKEYVLRRLLSVYGPQTLLSVPGFYERNGVIEMDCATPNYNAALIPCLNTRGITSLLRHTMYGPPEIAKYRTLPGTPARKTYTLGNRFHKDELWITEGIHKAHVAAYCSGVRIMGLLGVSISPFHLEVIREMKPSCVIEAYDSPDRWTNKQVAIARLNLLRALLQNDIKTYTATWSNSNGETKGIDDLWRRGKSIDDITPVDESFVRELERKIQTMEST